MDRREFMAISGAAAALLGAAAGPAEAAPAPPEGLGRSVTDFNIEPNTERDQSAALQKAIDEIAAAGQPIFIPAGRYKFAGINLPRRTHLMGAGPSTWLYAHPEKASFVAKDFIDISLSNFTLNGGADVQDLPDLIYVQLGGGGNVVLSGLQLGGLRGTALAISNAFGSIANVRASGANGIHLVDCKNFAVRNSFIGPARIGLRCLGASDAQILNNRFQLCTAAALQVECDAIISGNFTEGINAAKFGFRLGAKERLGQIMAVNNMIRGAEVGIGVSNADDGYALIAMNMIVGAKNGGIRALHGDSLTGPDLTKSSAESFRNLAIAANVSV